jgi:error-prone DNA polymerase
MTVEERLVADFRGTGLTTGPHPMTYHRAAMKQQGIRSAIELAHCVKRNLASQSIG